MKVLKGILSTMFLIMMLASLISTNAHAREASEEIRWKNPIESTISKYLPEKIISPAMSCVVDMKSYSRMLRRLPNRNALLTECEALNQSEADLEKKSKKVDFCFIQNLGKIEELEAEICASCGEWPEKLPTFDGGEAPDCEWLLAKPEATPVGEP